MRVARTLSGIFALIGFAVVVVAPATPAFGQTTTPAQKSYEFDIDAAKQWVDTNLDLRGGAKLNITATGQITYPADSKSKAPRTFGPDGLARGWRDLVHQYAVADAGHGALIGRLGSDEAAQPFQIGASKNYTAPVAGRLFLGINQSLKDAGAAQGSFHVTIAVTDLGPAGAAVAGGPADAPISGVTPDLLEKIPRRVRDPQGNPGDSRPVWCVAATHDVGFERDQRNNGVTHKIDPAIDGEREYVNATLSGTGFVIKRDHVTPSNALTSAKTATGGEFHSDGRIVVLVLKNGTAN